MVLVSEASTVTAPTIISVASRDINSGNPRVSNLDWATCQRNVRDGDPFRRQLYIAEAFHHHDAVGCTECQQVFPMNIFLRSVRLVLPVLTAVSLNNNNKLGSHLNN